MASEANAEEVFRAAGADLAAAVDAAVGGWVESAVARLVTAWAGSVPPEVREAARTAGERARHEVGVALAELVAADPDAAWTTPLSLLRQATRYPTAVLAELGVPPVVRDEVAERQFPDDVYDLTVASFADLGPAVGEAGLVWGAAKAHLHLTRRQAGRRRPLR